MPAFVHSDRHDSATLSLTAALWWLSVWFHDYREFTGTHGFTPDSLAGGVILLCLLAPFWWSPHSRRWRIVLLVFAAVWTVGEALSVLPLPIWPFAPDQSAGHYVTHAVVAAAQIPLIVLLCRPHGETSVRAPHSP